MGRFSPIGIFYLHLSIVSFGLIVFTILKNFDFANYENSPALTKDQVNFIWVFLLIGLVGIFISLLHGYFVKTPKYYTRAGLAVVLIAVGLVILIGMLIHDRFYGNEQNIREQEMLGIIFGSIITLIGSFSYISIKFPDETFMKYFKEAVKEEIRARRDEEQQWRLQQAQLKKQHKRIKEPKVVRREETEPVVEVSEFKEMKAPQTLEMVPPEAAGISIVKCSSCQRILKLTSQERPLTIKCPYCETIGVIKE